MIVGINREYLFYFVVFFLSVLIGILSAANSLVLIVLTVFLLATIIVFKQPNILIYVLLFLLPFHGFLVKLGLKGIGVFWKEALLLVLLFNSIMHLLFKKRRFYRLNKLYKIILLYVSYFILLSLFTEDWSTTIFGLSVYILYVLFFLSNIILNRDINNISTALFILTISIFLISLGGILQSLFHIELFNTNSIIEAKRFNLDRASFSMGSSIVFGSLMAIGAIIVFCRLLFTKNSRTLTIVMLLMLTFILFALLLSWTRAAWLQFFLSLLMVSIIGLYVRNKVFFKKIINFYSIVIISTILLLMPNFSKLYSFFDSGLETRQGIWIKSLILSLESPLFGKGLGSTLWATRELRGDIFVTESFILQLFTESGLIGLILFLGIIINSIYFNIRIIIYYKKNDYIWINFASLGVTFGLLVNMLIAQSYNSWVINMIFWFSISIPVIVNNKLNSIEITENKNT